MKRLGAALVLVWLGSLPLLTVVRAHDWQSEVALWRGAALLGPQKVRPRVNLGVFAHMAGDTMLAEHHYRIALDLAANPARPAHERRHGCRLAAHNLALLAQQQGRWADAVTWGATRCD